MARLLQIGTFAMMTRLSARMLRYYDERGLLKPAHVDPDTGYRYYRADQAQLAEVIRLLRAFDTPLGDIRVALDTAEAGGLQRLLERQRDRVKAEIAEKQRSLSYLERLIAHGAMDDESPSDSAELVEVDALRYVSRRARRTLDDVGVYTGETIGLLYAAVAEPSGPPFAIYHPAADAAGFEVEVGLPVVAPATVGPPLENRTLPGGRHAALLHVGPYEELGRAYRALGLWTWLQGFQPAGPPRETYLTSPGAGLAPAEYRTRLSWPVVANDV